jgi:hypothetical protein
MWPGQTQHCHIVSPTTAECNVDTQAIALEVLSRLTPDALRSAQPAHAVTATISDNSSEYGEDRQTARQNSSR